jgi:hypothetical protein
MATGDDGCDRDMLGRLYEGNVVPCLFIQGKANSGIDWFWMRRERTFLFPNPEDG